MGTWGPGNLDSDYAREELATRTSALIAPMLERARRTTSREADEYDYTTLFVELELAIALGERDLLDRAELPKPREVKALAKGYIKDWDAYIDKLAPTPAHKRKRRAIILDTFARFAKVCEPSKRRATRAARRA